MIMDDVKILLTTENSTIPKRVTSGSAGYDIFSNVDTTIAHNTIACVTTGIQLAIPEGYYGQLISKSGMAKEGLTVVGGVIDSDYRGEIKVLLENRSGILYEFPKGCPIAQIIFLRCEEAEFSVMSPEQWGLLRVNESATNQRKDSGFGDMDKATYV